MYNPRWFKEDRLQFLQSEIQKISFGTLVTTTDAGMLASHIPMMLDVSKGERGLLYGHVSRGNSQWRKTSPGAEGLAMFIGPDAYITPRWYQSKKEDGKVVPTWNYSAIHVRGSVEFFEDSERLKEVVTKLTSYHEHDAAEPWKVSDAPGEYIESQLKSIVGFEMPIISIEGKWKMSQNRPTRDSEGVIDGLDARDRGRDAEVSEHMRALNREQKKKE